MKETPRPNFLKPAFDFTPQKFQKAQCSPSNPSTARPSPSNKAAADERVRCLEKTVKDLQAEVQSLKKQLINAKATGKQSGDSNMDTDISQWDLVKAESAIQRIDAEVEVLGEARENVEKRLVELKCAQLSTPRQPFPVKDSPVSQGQNCPYKELWKKLGGDNVLTRNKEASLVASNLVAKSASKFEDGHIGFWQQTMLYKTQTFNELQKDATKAKEVFDRLIMQVVNEINLELRGKLQLTAHLPRIKGADRGEKKCAVKYGGDVSQMSDMVRGTISVKGNVDDLYRVVKRFVSSPCFQTRFAHFTFFSDRYQSPLGNYRDILSLLRITGFVCELQFNLECMLAVKESAGGHGQYENTRLANDNLLMALMRNKELDAIEALHSGAKPDTRECIHGMGCLHFAAFHNSIPMLRKLLQKSADPYVCDQYGLMPLYHAVLKGHMEAAEILTEYMTPDDLLAKLTVTSGPPIMWCAEIAAQMGLDGSLEEIDPDLDYLMDQLVTGFLEPVVQGALDHSLLEVKEAAAHALHAMGDLGKQLGSKRLAVLAEVQKVRDGNFLDDHGFSDLKPLVGAELIDELDLRDYGCLTPDVAPVIGRILMKCRSANLSGQKRLFAKAQGPLGLVAGLGDAARAGLGNGSFMRLEALNFTGCNLSAEVAGSLGTFLGKCPALVKLEGVIDNKEVFASTESLVEVGAGLGLSLTGLEGLDLTQLGGFRPCPALQLQGLEDLGRLIGRCPALAIPEGLAEQANLLFKHLLSCPPDHLTAFLAGLGDTFLHLGTLDVRLPLEKFDLRKGPISTAQCFGRLLSRCPSAEVTGLEDHVRRLVSSPDRLAAFLVGIGDLKLGIEKLDLKRCNIVPEAAAALGRLLARCSALKTLNLTENSWLFASAAPLAALLEGIRDVEFSQLENLYLWNSDVAPEAASGLGQLLKHCPALTKLHLWDNPRFFATPSPAKALVAELDDASLVRLQHLDLEDCDASSETKDVLRTKWPGCSVSE